MDDTLANNDKFGSSVVSPGDLDGDGVADLVVGAYRDEDSGCSGGDCGAVWVFLLQGQPSPGTVKDTYHAGGLLRGYQKLSNSEGLCSEPSSIVYNSRTYTKSGGTWGVRDDGVDYFWSKDSGHWQERSGSAPGTLVTDCCGTASTCKGRGDWPLAPDACKTGGVLGADDQFGASVASLGDLDGDLVPDLVVGAPKDDDGGTNKGALYLLFLDMFPHFNLTGTCVGECDFGTAFFEHSYPSIKYGPTAEESVEDGRVIFRPGQNNGFQHITFSGATVLSVAVRPGTGCGNDGCAGTGSLVSGTFNSGTQRWTPDSQSDTVAGTTSLRFYVTVTVEEGNTCPINGEFAGFASG